MDCGKTTVAATYWRADSINDDDISGHFRSLERSGGEFVIVGLDQVGSQCGPCLAKTITTDPTGVGVEVPSPVFGEEYELCVLHEDKYEEGV